MRPILLLSLLSTSFLQAQTAAPAKAPTPALPKEPALTWHAVGTGQWDVEGRAWSDAPRLRYFDRLPAAAEKQVPPAVWSLSRDSAGMVARFKTDADAIWVDYTLKSERIGMPHMPATGVSGVDLYARDEQDGGQWKWVQVSKPATQKVRAALITGLRPGLREYAAFLPLYNSIETLSIGVPATAKFESLAPRTEKPIVFYGTSITHGASASRPGMVHSAILGRRLDRPVINLGFSGNGKMDASVGDYLTRIDAAVFVIDCLPNMQPPMVTERTIPLVKQLRTARPDTPIILVEDRRFTNAWITPAKSKFHDDNHAALKAAYDSLIKEGIQHLHYIPGDALYGTDSEGATDASHANDLGFMRQADIFEPVLRRALTR
jgi:hypothetical protein